jgi:hypothetical protein
MAQEHISNQAVHLTARYTIKRLHLYQMPATTQQLSRQEVILDIDSTTADDRIQRGDIVELEIDLPVLLGFPQRHIYCRCRIAKLGSDETGTHVSVDIDTIRIRGEDFYTHHHDLLTTLLM